MEIQKEQNAAKPCSCSKPACHSRANALTAGLIFIAVGVLILLRNIGAIDYGLYRILLSWQMLLIVLGVWSLFQRHLTGGIILAAVGVFFMIPMLSPVCSGWTTLFWPFIFILLGIIVITHIFRPRKQVKRHGEECHRVSESVEGVVNVDNSFGMVRHIVLDPIFEGAHIRTRFSGTVIDLKRTALAEGETYIDVDMTLSGLEIHVPEDWTVIVDQVAMTMAGVDDKRLCRMAPDASRKLVVRGNMVLSGIEIKS